MSRKQIVDVMPTLQKMFLSIDSRLLFDLLFKQTKAFENVFLQNVSALFDKVKERTFAHSPPSDLAEILSNKFEIDLCSLDYKSRLEDNCRL